VDGTPASDGAEESNECAKELKKLKDQKKIARKEVKTVAMADGQKLFHELQKCNSFAEMMTSVSNAKTRIKACDEANDKLLYSIAIAASFFVDEDVPPDKWALRNMTFEDIELAMKRNSELWNLARFRSREYTPRDECEFELKNVDSTFVLTNKMSIVAKEHATEALALLGINNPNPFVRGADQFIDESKFTTHKEQLLELANKMTKLRKLGRTPDEKLKSGRPKKSKVGTSDAQTFASTRLSNELKLVFGTQFKRVRGSVNATKGFKYIADAKLADLLQKSNHTARLDISHAWNQHKLNMMKYEAEMKRLWSTGAPLGQLKCPEKPKSAEVQPPRKRPRVVKHDPRRPSFEDLNTIKLLF